MEENFGKEAKLRKELDELTKKLEAEKNELHMQLMSARESMGDIFQRQDKLTADKADLEKQVAVMWTNFLSDLVAI